MFPQTRFMFPIEELSSSSPYFNTFTLIPNIES
jgi:hypothetical protein